MGRHVYFDHAGTTRSLSIYPLGAETRKAR
jgi:hypothetical protein